MGELHILPQENYILLSMQVMTSANIH